MRPESKSIHPTCYTHHVKEGPAWFSKPKMRKDLDDTLIVPYTWIPNPGLTWTESRHRHTQFSFYPSTAPHPISLPQALLPARDNFRQKGLSGTGLKDFVVSHDNQTMGLGSQLLEGKGRRKRGRTRA